MADETSKPGSVPPHNTPQSPVTSNPDYPHDNLPRRDSVSKTSRDEDVAKDLVIEKETIPVDSNEKAGPSEKDLEVGSESAPPRPWYIRKFLQYWKPVALILTWILFTG